MAPRGITPRRTDEAISEYLDWMRAIKESSRNTLRNTESVLRRVSVYMGNPMTYNIERNTVNRYLADRRSGTSNHKAFRDCRGALSVDSLNQEKSRIRTFLAWCQDEQYLDPAKNVCRDLKWIEPRKTDRKRLTADQFQALYDATDCTRDRMLMILLTDLLVRGSEAVTIQWGGVDFDQEEVHFIRWKTNEEDVLPMSGPLRQALASYQIWYESMVDRPVSADDYLICAIELVQRSGRDRKSDDTIRLKPFKPMSRVHEIVQQSLVKIGFEGEAGAHSPLLKEGGHTIRRSAARELIEALFQDHDLSTDEALLMVMNMLGHKSIDMTMRYIGYDREKEKVFRLLKGKDWWRFARPAQVIQLAPTGTSGS